MRIVRNNHVLYAEPIQEPLIAPGPGGEPIEIARPGDYVTWAETENGFAFKGILSDQEVREKHRKLG